MLFESCVESASAAAASARGGADRIELCANLDAGGTTPTLHDLERAATDLDIPIVAMARVRLGPFVYSADEIRATVRAIRALRAAGARGIVLGALTAAGDVDDEATARLVDAAHPLPVTFHRAFDETRDRDRALDALLALGVSRVLTSGGAPSAREGSAELRRLCLRAAGRLTVLAAGGVRADHVAALVIESGVAEVHARLAQGRCETPETAEALTAAVAEMVAVVAGLDGSSPHATSSRLPRP